MSYLGQLTALVYYIMSISICQADKVEVLADKSASGRTRPWAIQKLNNTYVSMAYEEVDEKKAERMRTCAEWLSFYRTEGGGLKLHNARFCRVRLCPICQWRRSLKTFAQMSQVLDVAKNDGYEFLFLTLTMKNCTGLELSEALDKLLLSFNRFSKYKAVKQAVKGWYRGCEVTHNIVSDTYHPHLHVILAVNKSYFKSRYYLSQEKFTELWKKALQVDYTPILDVRRCKGGVKAIAEACKYAVKASDIISVDDWDLTVETVRTLDAALNNRRFVGLGGVLKDIHKQLQLDDMDEGDLLHIESDTINEEKQEEVLYFWNGYSRNYER